MKNFTHRNLKTSLILILFAVLCGCSKDDEQPTAKEMSIGKWFFVKQTMADGSELIAENECEMKSYSEFDTDDVYTLASFSLDADDVCKGSVETAQYAVVDQGKSLMFVSPSGQGGKMNILTLDKTTLELQSTRSGIIMLLEK